MSIFIDLGFFKDWSQIFYWRQKHSFFSLPVLLWCPQQLWGQWQTGLGFRGLNLNFGGVHSQQQGHKQGHLHLPGGAGSLQHSQQGLLTQAPNVHGKVTEGQHPPLQPCCVTGWPKPPQQFPHWQPAAHHPSPHGWWHSSQIPQLPPWPPQPHPQHVPPALGAPPPPQVAHLFFPGKKKKH